MICDAIAYQLRTKWEQRVKPGSRHILPIDPSDVISDDKWTVVSVLDCLGHFVSADGTIRAPFKRTSDLVWKAFYAKFHRGLTKHLDDSMLAAEITLHLEPVAMYRASGWPYQRKAAAELDALQARLVSASIALPRMLDEPIDEFHRRRGKVANHLADQSGRWSVKWAMRVVSWHAHTQRNTCGLLWSGLLANTRNASWLSDRRSLFAPRNSVRADAWTSFAGRTDTRLKRGSPAVRYESGVVAAGEVLELHRQSKLVAAFFKRQAAAKLPRNCGTNAVLTAVQVRGSGS
jgi:hypothetical protein